MYTAIMNNGDYQEINARTDAQAISSAFSRWTSEEAQELEIEVIRDGSDTAILTWEEWDEPILPDVVENTLRVARISSGLTQQQLADAAGMNISQIQRLEYGDAKLANVTAANFLALSDALKIDPHELLR